MSNSNVKAAPMAAPMPPHPSLYQALESFFSMNDLPDIMDAINAVTASHIQSARLVEAAQVADTVFLAHRASAFLVRLNAEWCNAQKEATHG